MCLLKIAVCIGVSKNYFQDQTQHLADEAHQWPYHIFQGQCFLNLATNGIQKETLNV